MFRSWKLGTMFGIGIYVHATFLLLPLFLFLANLDTGLGWALYAVMMIPAVFGCVVLHELGHALTARHYGIETRDITLYPIGGVARLGKLPQRPLEEFWIAVAGPAVNVAIAALLAGIYLFAAGTDFSILTNSLLGLVLFHLLIANVLLVLFNMLPAFPMDGGRVLRALLATHLGQLRATTIAVQIGIAMAVVFGIVGLLYGQLMLAVIGVFVFLVGQQELAAVRYRYAHQTPEPLDVIPVLDDEYDWPTPARRGGFSGFTWDSGAGRWVEWRNGRPVHTISVN